jgi:hypothetical protein
MGNPIRTAIGEALDFPFAEQGFKLVDAIEITVNEYDSWDDACDALDVDSLLPYTYDRVTTWLAINAQGAAEAEGFYEPTMDALKLIAMDLQVLIHRAAEAGYAVRVDKAFSDLEGDDE